MYGVGFSLFRFRRGGWETSIILAIREDSNKFQGGKK